MANPRYQAIHTATARTVRTFERPTDKDGRVLNSNDYYGCNAFGVSQMREYVANDVVNQFVEIVEQSGQGLVEDRGRRSQDDRPPRRYYGITALGRKVVSAEAARLQEVVRSAARLDLIPEHGRS